MRRKFGMFAVAGGMHTEVETGKGADADIDFFIRRFTAWVPGALSCARSHSRPSRMPTDTV